MKGRWEGNGKAVNCRDLYGREDVRGMGRQCTEGKWKEGKIGWVGWEGSVLKGSGRKTGGNRKAVY